VDADNDDRRRDAGEADRSIEVEEGVRRSLIGQIYSSSRIVIAIKGETGKDLTELWENDLLESRDRLP
jgi:hypothetical protein